MEHDIVAGKHPVMEALQSDRPVHKIWLNQQMKSLPSDVFKLAEAQQVMIEKVSKKQLDQWAKQTNHQGILAAVEPYQFVELDRLFQQAEQKNESPFFILLDEISDPHNLGSIMRTADAAGAHGIIIPKRRSVGLTQTVAKTSAGAIEYMPVARVANLSQTIKQLKERGLWLAAADADGYQDYRDAELSGPVGIVIGSEGKGVSRLVKEHCDFIVRLPMHGRVSSLNASVAAGLLMYEIEKCRVTSEEPS